MKAVIQRVKHAKVDVDGETVGEIGQGFLILLGVGCLDTEQVAEKLWAKISKLRIFSDLDGKSNLSLKDVQGEALIVSQFTLYANCQKGNRPSFTSAGDPEKADRLYRYFVSLARQDAAQVATGVFGAMMDITSINAGPYTIILDSDEL